MACPDGWLKLKLAIKILFVSTVVAFCVVVIGFATPVWISASWGGSKTNIVTIDHLGLWQACGSDSGCIDIKIDLPAFYVATRVFACFSLISSFVATVLVFLFACLSKGENGRMLVFTMIASFVTSGLVTITVGIFAGEINRHLSFSFAMMCIAAIIYCQWYIVSCIHIRWKKARGNGRSMTERNKTLTP